MISRFVAIALFCGSSLVLHVPVARGQGLVPTFGEFITGHISDAINAAHQARAHMDNFRRDIAAARKRYRECGGTCADKDRIAAKLDELLTSKDFYYAFMRSVGRSLRGIEGSVHMDLVQRVLGDVDGGMPSYAAKTFRRWTRCLDGQKKLGLFINVPGSGAFEACQDAFLAHRERRNLWEFYERPGVREALLAAGAPAAGARLFKEQRETADSDLLPDGIGAAEILKCEYGPSGSDTDSLLQVFYFWYGKVPASRVELLKRLKWAGPWKSASPRRNKYLRMPEISCKTCPPGALNALALSMNQTDSEEFLAIEWQRKRLKRQRAVEVQRSIAEDAQRDRAEDIEYNRQVNAGAQKLVDAWRVELNACRKKYPRDRARRRECENANQKRYRYALADLKRQTETSPSMRRSSNTIKGIGAAQGEFDACEGTSDITTRATTANLAKRAYPGSVSKLMKRYDFEYERRFVSTIDRTEKWREFRRCSEEMIAEHEGSLHRRYRDIREDIVTGNFLAGRTTTIEKNVLTHDQITDYLTIKTAYEAIEKISPFMFHGDLGARMRLAPNDPDTYDHEENLPCPGLMLYIDEKRAPRLEELHNIRVANIKQIEYIKGRDAVGIYGDDHHQGAILVTTMR